MIEELKKLQSAFQKDLKDLAELEELTELKNKYLGRKGLLAGVLKGMKDVADDLRKEVGEAANEVKQFMEEAYASAEETLTAEARAEQLEREWIDISQPGTAPEAGHLHPVSTAIAQVSDIFSRLGFSLVEAPEIDWDYYAFESLNMPADHPARDDWETFFVDLPEGEKGKVVLTPHTSNAQVRQMEKQDPPIRMIRIGRTYRRQSDISHVPMFHQFEGLMIDKGVTITHLKGVLDYFARAYFGEGRRTRLRPHHFRFTEPSFEVDISCGLCDGKGCRMCKAGWVELGGAGMVHPNVLKAGGVDPDVYSGFAFGWGVERTMMMRSGIKIDDIRILYKNDLRFVKQF